MALEQKKLNHNNYEIEISNRTDQNIIYTNEENLLLSSNNKPSNNNESDEIRTEEIISFLKLCWTILTMFLFISDIFSDLILAIYFYINGRKTTCIIMLFCVYMSSLFSSLFERHTRKQSGFCHYLRCFLIFVFNLSGILLYKEIILLNIKELGIIKKYNKINENNRKILEEKKRDLAFLKLIEGITEAFPQIFFQIFVIDELRNSNEYVSLLQYATLSTSFLGLATTGVGFVISVTPDKPEPNVILLIVKFSWLICTTVSRLVSIYLLVFINYSSIPFLVVFNVHLQIGRFCYSVTSEKQSNTTPTKCSFLKNEFPGTLYGLLFVITPYISCTKDDYYEKNTMIVTHLFHFSQIFIVTILWAVNQSKVYKWNPFVYVSLIIISIGGFIVGVLFLIIFKKYKPKDITTNENSTISTNDVLVS